MEISVTFAHMKLRKKFSALNVKGISLVDGKEKMNTSVQIVVKKFDALPVEVSHLNTN